MPAKATTFAPSMRRAALASGASRPWNTGLPAAVNSAAAFSPASPSPMTSPAEVCFNCRSTGARKGPAGSIRPLPNPTPPSITARVKSRRRLGFCSPSSITIRLAPPARASMAPVGRSRATTVLATRASSSGSSPASAAQWRRRSDQMGAAIGAQRAAIAARQEIGGFAGALQPFGDRQGGWGLAGAPGDEIADADHRRIHPRAAPGHPPDDRPSVEDGNRRQNGDQEPGEQARLGRLPEIRRAHGSSQSDESRT